MDLLTKSKYFGLQFRKYEEIGPPHMEDFCYITDNTYTKQEVRVLCSCFPYLILSDWFMSLPLSNVFNNFQVLKMETEILKFLSFEMGNPTIKTFLRC